MRIYLVSPVLAGVAAVFASDYSLSINAQRQGDTVLVAPTVRAPPGKVLRYEMMVRRQGGSQSSSNTSGDVTVDADGRVTLARMSLSAASGDRCEISIVVYDGDSEREVASQKAQCPR